MSVVWVGGVDKFVGRGLVKVHDSYFGYNKNIWQGIMLEAWFKAEQHPVVIFTMFCSLFQIAISFFEGINMHLKEHFLRTAKISFKFEWINWYLNHWSQCGRVSSAYSFAYNFLSLIPNSPKWRNYVSGEPAALKWCIYCLLMFKFEGKSPKIYVRK